MEFDASPDFSQISNQSDEVKSTISSISGLSEYQDEFVELRHLVNPEKYANNFVNRDQASTPVNDSGCDLHYEDRISDLSYQLQNTLKQNEHYKNELYNLEIKFEIKYHDKFEKLLRSNSKLEIELSKANEQIQRLIKNYSGRNGPKLEKEHNFLTLENKYHHLALENSDLEKKFLEMCRLKKELEHLNQRLKIDLNDSKLVVETKNVCIKELKEKIAQQFVEIQAMTKHKNVSAQKLNEINSELEQVIKLLDWYKNQVQVLQDEKKSFAENISGYRLEILDKNSKIDKLNLELKSLQHNFELYQLEVLKQKEKLYMKLNEQNSPQIEKIELKADGGVNETVLSSYKEIIQELNNELSLIKIQMQEQDENIKKMNSENAELLSRCLVTGKILQTKNSELSNLDFIKKQLIAELNLLKDERSMKNSEIDLLKNDKIKLETEILSCKGEKEIIDISIKTIRDQFQGFLCQYKKLKDELSDKNKQILNLQSEKQALFMNNNWKICELEKSKCKDITIEKLKEDNIVKEKIIGQYIDKIKLFEMDLKYKDKQIEDNKLEFERYNKVLIEYKNMVEEYQCKVKNLEDTVASTKLLTKDLKENLNIVKSEISRRDKKICELTDQNQAVLKEIGILKEEKEVLKHDKETITENNNCFENPSIVFKTDQINQTDEKYILVQNQGSVKHKDIIRKFINLMRRVKYFERSILDSKKLLNTFLIEKMVSEKEKTELNALLQVKELEMKEKQKKYERNYRTLLRKVREHMKGRNTAEKQNKYLQEIYNNICEENNSLKLSLSSKSHENDENKKILSDFIGINEKLKKDVLDLERKLKISDICMRCAEFEVVKEKLETLERDLVDLTQEKHNLELLVIGKENLVLDLQQKVRELQCQIAEFIADKKTQCAKIEAIQLSQDKFLPEKENLLKQLEEKQLNVSRLSDVLEKEHHRNEDLEEAIFTLKKELRDTEDKLECITNEKEALKDSLRAITEELEFLKAENSSRDAFWSKQSEEHQKTAEGLRRHVQGFHNELSAVNSEKYFIQRICNDLKIALKSHVNQNQILKQKLDMVFETQQDSFNTKSSLPDLPSLQGFDENFVNNLLQEIRVTPTEKPLSEIQLSLETLRKEIFTLQEQILKKNLRTA